MNAQRATQSQLEKSISLIQGTYTPTPQDKVWQDITPPNVIIPPNVSEGISYAMNLTPEEIVNYKKRGRPKKTKIL